MRYPWRTTFRTVFQGLIGLAVALPIAVEAAGIDAAAIPWLAGALGVAAVATRIMAVPAVEQRLRDFLPFLAAVPKGEAAVQLEDGVVHVSPLPHRRT